MEFVSVSWLPDGDKNEVGPFSSRGRAEKALIAAVAAGKATRGFIREQAIAS